MEKRLFLAVVFSILVMLVYPFFLAKIRPQSTQNPQLITQPAQEEEDIETYTQSEDTESAEETLPPDAISRSFLRDRYNFTFTNIGGSIQNIGIRDGKRLDMDLVEKAIYEEGILAIEGKGALAGISSQVFAIKEDTSSFYVEKNGLSIEKDINFLKDKYGLSVDIKFSNRSDAPQLLSYEITTASRISNKELYESRYIEAAMLFKDGRLKRIAGRKLRNSNKLYNNNIEWLALKNKYYSIIAKPNFSPKGVFTKSVDDFPSIGFIIDKDRILPGESKVYNFIFYIGPTEINELEKVDKGFGKALNFGIFTGISLVLLSILKFFYFLFHNYGVSILLLTCCVSLTLYPLTFKSLKSMRKLQELQPHIEKVRSEHKDNPQKLNKEIMEIYRRYKVNPMGGCLPMFLQMPIFIALYQTLMRSVELKGASFLWIKDLSMPDRAFPLPVNLPFLGNAINLLPILMIGAMILQQKMSSMKSASLQTEQQKMMSTVMPIVFGVIFYSLPSGLVLYWLTNTLLTSSMQFLLLRKT